ncbi:MAG: MarR family winged helix-turn-helix transcriptional regulator [Candidatus Aenigmatarchaeota archaeon]
MSILWKKFKEKRRNNLFMKGSYFEEVSYLLSSSLSLKILIAISSLPFPTPTLIAKTIKCSPSNVSTKLIKLREKGLTICITPERRKGRIYKLTKKGKIVIGFLNNSGVIINFKSYELGYEEGKSKIKRI